jgi:hypothetical protein
MKTLLLAIILPLLLIAFGVYAVVRRGFQMRQLVQDGVETNGTVAQKLEYPTARGSRRSSRRLRYEYRDAAGRVHSHVSMVTADFWNAHAVGGPIAIVYSRSRPQVSSPRHLVDLSRQALAGKA